MGYNIYMNEKYPPKTNRLKTKWSSQNRQTNIQSEEKKKKKHSSDYNERMNENTRTQIGYGTCM